MSKAPIELMFVAWNSPNVESPFCFSSFLGPEKDLDRIIEWSKGLVAKQWITDEIIRGLISMNSMRHEYPDILSHKIKMGSNIFSMARSAEGGIELNARTLNPAHNLGSPDVAVHRRDDGAIGINLPSGDKESRTLALACMNLFTEREDVPSRDFFDSNRIGKKSVGHGEFEQVSLGGARRMFEYRPYTS